MLPLFRGFRGFLNFLAKDYYIPRRWLIYFVIHFLIVIYVSAWALCELCDCDILSQGPMWLLNQMTAMYVTIAPLVTIRMLFSATGGVAALFVLGFVDALLCAVHFLALRTLC